MSDSEWDSVEPAEMMIPTTVDTVLAQNWRLIRAIDSLVDSFADCFVDMRSMWTYSENWAMVG